MLMSATWLDLPAPPLVTIQGLDPIYTDFTVAENDLPLVRKYLGGPNVKVKPTSRMVRLRRGSAICISSTTQCNPAPER